MTLHAAPPEFAQTTGNIRDRLADAVFGYLPTSAQRGAASAMLSAND